MDILGDRKFVEVPGEKTHELPPLLVRTTPNVRRLDRVVGMANTLIESEDMIPPPAFEFIGRHLMASYIGCDPDALRDLDAVTVDADAAASISTGLPLDRVPLGAIGDGPWAMLDEAGSLLAVYEATGSDRIRPAVVLAGPAASAGR